MSAHHQFMSIKEELENVGHQVLAPDVEFEMTGNDTPVGAYAASSMNHDTWHTKGEAMTKHFRKIDRCEAILVTNYEKKGVQNYIGGNTFLEMGYAFGTGKTIYVLHTLPTESPFMDEMLAMQPIILTGDISKIR